MSTVMDLFSEIQPKLKTKVFQRRRMRAIVGVLVLLCLVSAGCNKAHSSKQVAAVNTDSLSVNEADKLLAQPTDKIAPSATPAVPPAVVNAVAETEVAPKTEAAPSAKEEIDLKMVQQALKNLGLYAGEVDGKIGHKTKEAVKEFQKRNNLSPDGKVGPKTWALLKKALEIPASSVPQAGVVQK